MDSYKGLLIDDPETKTTYRIFVSQEDYKRAHEDAHFVSALLTSAKEKIELPSVSVDVDHENSQISCAEFSEANVSMKSNYVPQIENVPSLDKHVWKHNETLSFITSMQAHYEDLNHPKKRKHVFENIANELVSLGFNVIPTQCQIKWKSLVRTYTTAKDNKNKTGRGPIRFQFFDEIDAILGNKPSNQCEHSMESVEDPVVSTNTVAKPSTCINSSLNENASDNDADAEITENEQSYYKDNTSVAPKKKKRKRNEDLMKEKQKEEEEKKARHRERIELERQKLELDREKIALFREYLQRKQ